MKMSACIFIHVLIVTWCVLIYTPFIRPKPDQKDQKHIKNAKYLLVFVFCACAGTGYEKWTKESQNRQNEHGIWKELEITGSMIIYLKHRGEKFKDLTKPTKTCKSVPCRSTWLSLTSWLLVKGSISNFMHAMPPAHKTKEMRSILWWKRKLMDRGHVISPL